MNSSWSFSSSETIDHGSGSPASLAAATGQARTPSPHPAAMSLELYHYESLQRNSARAMPAMQVRGIQTETNLPPLVADRILHLLVHVPVCLRSRVRVPRIGVIFCFSHVWIIWYMVCCVLHVGFQSVRCLADWQLILCTVGTFL